MIILGGLWHNRLKTPALHSVNTVALNEKIRIHSILFTGKPHSCEDHMHETCRLIHDHLFVQGNG